MIFDVFTRSGQETSRTGLQRFEPVFVLLITVVAAVIRWFGIHRSLWVDELGTSWVVRDGFSEIFPRSVLNNLSPLYYVLVWISDRVWGYNEVGLRFPSFAAGVLLVPGVYFVARSLSGSRTAAILSATIAAFDPTASHYSIEARPYALIQLFALLNIVLFIHYDRRRSLFAALMLFMNAALLFYLHYTSALFILVDGLLLVLSWIRGPLPSRKELGALVIAGAAFAVSIIPAMTRIAYLLSNKGALAVHLTIPSFTDSLTRFNVSLYVIAFPILALLVSFIFEKHSDELRHPGEQGRNFRDNATRLALWGFVPSVLVYLFAKLGLVNITLDRYVISSSVASMLIPSLLLVSLCFGVARQITTAIVAMVMLMISMSFLRNVDNEKVGYRDCRSLVTQVNATVPSDLPVYVVCGLAESVMLAHSDDPLLRDYLLCIVNSAYPLRPDLLARAKPIASVDSLTPQVKGSFLYIGPYTDLAKLRHKASSAEGTGEQEPELEVFFPDQAAGANYVAVRVEY